MSAEQPFRPWRDGWLWGAVFVGVVLRVLPMLIWGWAGDQCTRDECIYRIVTGSILNGEGLGLAPKGWLPAPGFPYLLALCDQWFGSIQSVKWVHVVLAAVSTLLVWTLGRRVFDLRTARWAAWLYAVHPTLAFFVGTMWTEIVYSTLLLSVCWSILWARDGRAGRAALVGLLLGVTVLFRGVVTYLAPVLALALIVPAGSFTWAGLRQGWAERRRHVLVFLCVAIVTVAPWSMYASARFGGPVISDATLGHVMSLGNNTFPPVTFDYGIGQLTGTVYGRTLRKGRSDCSAKLSPVDHDRCEMGQALKWVAQEPGTFVSRIPMRLAQLANPNSFLTRHIRWGYWPGLPFVLKEALVAWIIVSTSLIMLGGTVVVWARGRGPYLFIAAGIVIYTSAVISMLYGLTRFRLPLEPLWLVYLAAGISSPRVTIKQLIDSRVRLIGAVVSTVMVAWLIRWYLMTGYPGIW